MKKYLKYIILLIIFISSLIFMNHNEELYKTSILRITNKTITNKTYQYNNNLVEPYYEETITGTIINGNYKDKEISFNNIYSKSGVYDERYSLNDEVFISLTQDGEFSEVLSLRRDKYIIPLFILTICLLISIGHFKGLLTLISFIINIIVVYFITILRDYNISILLLFILGSIIICSLTLFLISGKSKKTIVSISSSLISLFITSIISFIIITIFNNDIPYWYMDYVEVLYDYKEVFYISTIISGLGAIMDISISITSTINELITNTPKISLKSLKKSINYLSDDILGTMVNVLLFTSISGTIPMIIYVVRNNIPVLTAFNMYGKIEMIRFMTGSIGLLIAIPITTYIAFYIYKGRKVLK